MRALSMSGALPDPEAMEWLFDLHQRHIAETLTPEQREQMGQRHWGRVGPDRSAMGRRGDRGPGGSTMRGPGKTFDQFDLSDEQGVKLNALVESQYEEMQALMKEHREAIQALIRVHREAMENVLTKAQRAELEEIKDDEFYHSMPRRAPRWVSASVHQLCVLSKTASGNRDWCSSLVQAVLRLEAAYRRVIGFEG